MHKTMKMAVTTQMKKKMDFFFLKGKKGTENKDTCRYNHKTDRKEHPLQQLQVQKDAHNQALVSCNTHAVRILVVIARPSIPLLSLLLRQTGSLRQRKMWEAADTPPLPDHVCTRALRDNKTNQFLNFLLILLII
ncbi:hypothetical protein, unlikely [Trypanosoma congolense IL3000]|uniref:Uncharacterized protein n=1 Tax=Trypanosoma congolense (strain IL3000) TaxID=1068625 RepID=F9WGP5_TRYCI|nr:hypothetical protein, unlikely [Trypanosoma congolense IL3000]